MPFAIAIHEATPCTTSIDSPHLISLPSFKSMKYSKGILSLLVIAASGSSAASADNANNQTTNDDRRRLSPSDPMARILGQGNGKDNAPGQAKKRFKLAAKVAGSETGQLLEVDVKEVTNAITSATTMGSSKLPIGKDLDAIYVCRYRGYR